MIRPTFWIFLSFCGFVDSANAEWQSHLSILSQPKHSANFTHFDYVDPQAPKGGTVRLHGEGSFDSTNPFIVRGVAPRQDNNPISLTGPVYESLMEAAMDEADVLYPLIAEAVEVDADRNFVRFRLNPKARFHDGAAITTSDVQFTYEQLKANGQPQFALQFKDVSAVEIISSQIIEFRFRAGLSWAERRDLPFLLASLPVLSKKDFAARDFASPSDQLILASGPYRISLFEPGRRYQLSRVVDHWAKDLPVYQGRWNFDKIDVAYYRDRSVSLEAFKSYEYDWREEYKAAHWVEAYEFDAVKAGHVVKLTQTDGRPSGFQGWFLNTRKDKFKDIRTRTAINLAFDFDWANKNLFHHQYQRMESLFVGTDMVDPTHAYKAPKSDGSGQDRQLLRQAAKLLKEAGWQMKDGQLRNNKGEPLEIEFLQYDPSFERIVAPFADNLKRLGIAVTQRRVDVPQFMERTNQYDFDVIGRRYSFSPTPGLDLLSMFHSKAADQPGSQNLSGIKDPVIDQLLEAVAGATDRKTLIEAAQKLDRQVMAGHYFVPNWTKGTHTLAFWNRFGRPKVKPPYDLAFIDTWWIDPDLAAKLDQIRPRP